VHRTSTNLQVCIVSSAGRQRDVEVAPLQLRREALVSAVHGECEHGRVWVRGVGGVRVAVM